ncbi:hypothetical protein [Candidatus Palauibacter sp.]|uniref:hypothetical protein n=1 Tax=Candidatus Palauibacter sp. TaxID=3101350 RepID=UPI003B022736
MKNTTTTLLEDVARWLKGKAAEAGRSVSGWISVLLVRARRQNGDYAAAMKRYLARKPRRIDWPDGRRPAREQLYDRPGLR